MQDLISVMIPIYNVDKYLNKCIDSVLNQTYSNLEIILVNDGSTDKSTEICKQYEQLDNRIKVINKEYGGVSDARNVCVDVAKGKYIAFVDSDDYISSDYIEYMYNLINKYNTPLAICRVKEVWNNTNLKQIEQESNETSQLLNSKQAFYNLLFDKGIEVSVYAKLYKRELFEGIRFPKGKVYEDTAVMYKIIKKAKNIAFGTKHCYYYIARKGSISKHPEFNENEKDFIRFTSEMLNFIEKRYPDLKDAVKRFDLYARFRILKMLVFTNPRNREMEKEYVKMIRKNQKEVFKYKDTPTKDKYAIILLNMGLPIFKLSWRVYRKVTGRI